MGLELLGKEHAKVVSDTGRSCRADLILVISHVRQERPQTNFNDKDEEDTRNISNILLYEPGMTVIEHKYEQTLREIFGML